MVRTGGKKLLRNAMAIFFYSKSLSCWARLNNLSSNHQASSFKVGGDVWEIEKEKQG